MEFCTTKRNTFESDCFSKGEQTVQRTMLRKSWRDPWLAWYWTGLESWNGLGLKEVNHPLRGKRVVLVVFCDEDSLFDWLHNRIQSNLFVTLQLQPMLSVMITFRIRVIGNQHIRLNVLWRLVSVIFVVDWGRNKIFNESAWLVFAWGNLGLSRETVSCRLLSIWGYSKHPSDAEPRILIYNWNQLEEHNEMLR